MELISRHFTQRAANQRAHDLNAERKRMRSSGASKFDYIPCRDGKGRLRRHAVYSR